MDEIKLYKPYSKQIPIHKACNDKDTFFITAVAGRQAGKTALAEQQAIYWALNNNNVIVYWVSPTASHKRSIRVQFRWNTKANPRLWSDLQFRWQRRLKTPSKFKKIDKEDYGTEWKNLKVQMDWISSRLVGFPKNRVCSNTFFMDLIFQKIRAPTDRKP